MSDNLTQDNQSPHNNGQGVFSNRKDWSVTFWFIVIAVICSIVTWCIMSQANNKLSSTHQIILSHQIKSAKLVDSLYKEYQTIVSDTSLSNRHHRTAELFQSLINASNTIDVNQSNERISNLLESEFSKIQSEYEILNLWCALLTVVFLIFSFFSIFKANEMANQSENALNNMRRIGNAVHSKADEIEKEINQQKTNISKISNEVSSVANQKDALSNDIQSIRNIELKAISDDAKRLSESLTLLKNNSEAELQKFEQIYNSKIATFDQIVESSIQNMVSDARKILDKEIRVTNNDLKVELETLKNKYSEIHELFKDIVKQQKETEQPRFDIDTFESDADESDIDSDEDREDSDEAQSESDVD